MIVEALAAESLPEVFDLYRRTVPFPPPGRVEEYCRWKFWENPHRGDAPRVWVARQDGALAGAMAQMPVVLQVRGTSLRAAWAADLMVDPRFQGQGIGKRIFDHYRRHNDVAISMGYAPGSATSRLSRAVGFRGFPPIPFVFKLLTTKLATGALPLGRLVGGAIDRASGLVLRRVGRVQPVSSVRVEEMPRFTASFDALWARVEAEEPVAVRRDHATMNWRYVANPFYRHRVVGAWKGPDLAGCLVVKVVRNDALNYGTIAELVVPGEALDVQDTLLAWAFDHFEQANVDVVKSLASPRLAPVLRRAGFRALRQGSDFVIAVGAGVDPRLADTLGDPEAWYLTKGDCDLDMVPDFMSRVSPAAP